MQLEINNLKDILLHSRNNKDVTIEMIVPPSRYAKILSDYWTRYAINVDGLDLLYRQYDYYILTDLDSNRNAYKIIKDRKVKEEKSKCANCDCKFQRFINPETNVCYYKEAISKNYLVKI
jgi:hypothetical protein